MKLLVVTALICLCTHASAQTPKVQIPKRDYKIGERLIDKNKFDSRMKLFPQLKNYSAHLKLKPGTRYLADGMPCIVPQQVTAGLMPNVWNRKTVIPFAPTQRPMPNPAIPGVLFSDETTIVLKRP